MQFDNCFWPRRPPIRQARRQGSPTISRHVVSQTHRRGRRRRHSCTLHSPTAPIVQQSIPPRSTQVRHRAVRACVFSRPPRSVKAWPRCAGGGACCGMGVRRASQASDDSRSSNLHSLPSVWSAYRATFISSSVSAFNPPCSSLPSRIPHHAVVASSPSEPRAPPRPAPKPTVA